LRPTSSVCSLFLNYIITNTSFQIFLLATAKSKAATREALPKNIIDNLFIPLPPLPLQQAFAKRIEAIEKQKQLISSEIKDLETLLASRMQYWFD
jgi:type I restriction enzyme S subunit